jgi:hypothetical protein
LPANKKALLTLVAIVALGLACLAKTSKFTGKIVAYDVMRHASKASSGIQNEEIVILETIGQKQKYAKVVFSSFGTQQIEPKYFEGSMPIIVDVLRDPTCDEKSPTFVSRVNPEQMGGNYLLTDAFKSSPPARIKNLECYAAIYKKK